MTCQAILIFVSDDHVGLKAGMRSDGTPAIEVVPGEHLGGRRYRIHGSPALAMGCAAGDVVRVDDDANFVVESRAGNVGVQIYASTQMTVDSLSDLRDRFAALNGLVEWPEDHRFAVVTVPAASGFPEIEAAIGQWCAANPEVGWQFANVYATDGKPLNWWT